MIFKNELTTADQVKRWYENREGVCCFMIFTGVRVDPKQIFSKFVGADSSAGMDKLGTTLDFITENVSNSNTYTIIAFPYEEGIENIKVKDVEGETIRFQLNPSYYSKQNDTIAGITINNPPVAKDGNDYATYALNLLKEQNSALMGRLELLQQKEMYLEEEEEEEDEEPEPPTPTQRIMGALAGLIEKPQFQDVVIGAGMGLINRFFPQQNFDNGNGQQHDNNTGGNNP
jgi:hypothetical protein